MKKISYKIVIALFTLMGVSSCDSFLDVTPDNRLRIDSYEKVAELVANAYPNGSGVFMEWMSDNVGPDAKNVQMANLTQPYLWEHVDFEGQDTPSFYWSSNYTAIAHANQALLELSKLKNENPELKDAIRGEALACRAFAHFMLVNVFAKSYDSQTASSDLGIVIMEKPEVTLLAKYKRNTVQEVYDFVEKDLQEALKLVSDKYYKNTGRYHFTRNAVYALASRFYLFKKDYVACEKYSSMLLGDGYNDQLIRNYLEVYTGTSSESVAMKFTAPLLKSNLLLIRKDVFYGYMGYAGYRLTEGVYKTIALSQKDSRFSLSYNYGHEAITLPKFQRDLMKMTSITSSSGFPYTVEVALRAEETFFNRLEALLMLGDTKLPIFEAQFDKYISKVYAETVDYKSLFSTYKKSLVGATDAEIRLRMVLDEKRREFVEEGLRWFDICRHKIPVTHVDINGEVHQLTDNDPRKVLQIPQSAIEYGGLIPNEFDSANKPTLKLITRN